MEECYDAVIVGGGVGGLIAGNYLARAGLRVALFEQNAKVGGYVTSFQRGDYTFEAGLTSFGSNGIVFPILSELGLSSKVRLTLVKRALVTDQFAVRVDASFARLRAALQNIYPDEWAGIEEYFAWIESFSRAMEDISEQQLILEISKGLAMNQRAIRKLCAFSLYHARFLKSALRNYNLTKQEFHQKYFHSSALLDFLDGQGYPVMTVNTLGGMWYSFKSDYWYPLGGMQSFSNLLKESFLKAGGRVYLKTRVEKILFDYQDELKLRKHGKQQVKGVLISSSECRSGQAIGRSDAADCRVIRTSAVIADIDLKKTFYHLIGEEYLSPGCAEALANGEPSESMFAVFLGLKGKGFVAPSLKLAASHYFFQLQDGQGDKNEFALLIPTQEDPALAPHGETVILHCFEEYGDWVSLAERGEAYYRKKEIRTEECLQLVRQVIPDLDKRLEVVEAATPLTYADYTGSSKGATAGWNWNPRLKPHFNWVKNLPIKGLYLAGQWIYNPGGVPAAMLTGRKAALALLKQLENGKTSFISR